MANPEKILTLLPSGSTASAAPTAADQTLGVAIPFGCDQALILVLTTDVEVVAHTASLRMWGFNTFLDRWFAIGLLNGGTDLAEVAADRLDAAELLVGIHGFDRLYCQIVSLGGAASSISVHAVCRRAEITSR